ncbi:MAG: cell wall-binding repeat-containing protein [Acidimicrobiales bacterium]|nr:cell wall-binding repeat-containing protein [Acidimicrobiales bacterium]
MNNERKRVTARLVAGLLAVLVAGAGLALTSGSASALQTVTQSTRVSGVDAYATSASAAITSHTGAATASVLVSGESYADGLSAAALAGAVSAPVILTDPNTLKGSTSLAIGQINSTTAAGHTVYIVGGTAAVSADVATSLTDLGYTVSRVSGADRVATADAVATKIRTLMDFGTNWDSETTVFLTTARNFADAVAVSGLAWKNKSPILLVEPGDALSAGTKAVLDSAVNSIEHVIILGGTAAVSAAVETEVKTILNGAAGTTAIKTTRVGGTDRYDTAKKLMELRTKSTTLNGYGETATNVILVNGTSHQDGLSATALAGAAATMTLLTDGTGTLNATTSAALTASHTTISTVRAIGMTADLSAAEMTAADAAATSTTVTCTVTAAEGSFTQTVTFSGAVLGAEGDQDGATNADGTGAGLESNYKKNNTALAANSNATAGSAGASDVDQPNLTEVVGSTAAATAASIVHGTAFAVGDVLSAGTGITDTAGNAIAGCSTTVANDATRPTATVDSFKIGATTALLHFSEAVEDFAGSATAVSDDITSTSSGTDTTFLVTAAGGNYFLATHKDGSAFISGQILTISTSAGDFTDLGDLDMAANKTATASTDTTSPTATATVASSTYTRAITATMGTTGTFTVGAVAGGIAEGTIGNLWTFEAIEGSAGAVPVVSLFDTVNRKMVLAADFTSPTSASTPTADNICATINGHADIAGNFKCLVVAGGTSAAVVASTALSGGAVTHAIDVQFSETMATDFATIGYYTVDADADTSYADDGAESARTSFCTTALDGSDCSAYTTGSNSFISGAMQFNYAATTAAMDITKGSSVVGIATSVTDLKGNAVGSVTYRVTIN